MKKYSLLLVCFLALLCTRADASVFFSNTLYPGTYELRGCNNETGVWQYQGEVVIEQQGSNYGLTWFIGRKQMQVGVGILENDVLSVAYYDASNPNGTGVVSYRLTSDSTLEGKWAPINSTGFGREYLVWKSY
jgi:hypothetical protein